MKKKGKSLTFEKSIIEGVEIKRCHYSPHSYRPHVHNELSIGYIIEGSTDLSLNDNLVHFQKGDGVIIPPFMTHQCSPMDVEHWAYLMLYIDPSYYDGSVEFTQAKRLVGEASHRLRTYVDCLLEETLPSLLEETLLEMLIEFGESKTDLLEDEISNDGYLSLENKITLIHSYLISHVEEEMMLVDLAKRYELNKFTLIRLFKKYYNTTPASFHLQCRVAEAKNALSQGVTVLDVCERYKFYDQAHFIKAFKQMHGTTPTAYVEQLK